MTSINSFSKSQISKIPPQIHFLNNTLQVFFDKFICKPQVTQCTSQMHFVNSKLRNPFIYQKLPIVLQISIFYVTSYNYSSTFFPNLKLQNELHKSTFYVTN